MRPRLTSVGSPPLPEGSNLIRRDDETSGSSGPDPPAFGPQSRSPYVSSEFSPLGIRLAVEADSPELLAIVADTCRGWEGDADPTARLLRLKLVRGHGPCGTGDPEVQVEGQRLRVSARGVDAWADSASGCAECVIREDHLLDGEALRQEVLDPLLLFLLTRSGRTPIHASGFIAGELAVLLAGPSGTGKSCLALAAYEAGFDLLSDDTIYLQLQPELLIWGVPRPIHLFPDDAPTGSGNAVRVRNGKLKYSVPVGAGCEAVTARRAALCILAPGAKVSLQRIGREEAMRAHGEFEAGFDLLRGDIEAALELLARNGAWRLTLSANPAEAISLLRENLSGLGAVTAP